jgi:undecaprenyl diphosphate synthase
MAIVLDPRRTEPPAPLQLPNLPKHVAIIMDGNGRWARERGRSRIAGHRAGTENIRKVIERVADYGIRYLTLFAFSTENWNRPRYEVRGLMQLLNYYLRRETMNLHENGIKVVHLGDLSALNGGLQKRVLDAIDFTKNNDRMTLALAWNYGGRAEIVEAVKRIAIAGIPPEEIDESIVSAYLTTADLPDPDLIIRTAGEMRISNFLLWQAAYAELCFVPHYWPDFGPDHIDEALLTYSRRTRRFGAIPAGEQDRGPLNGARENGASTQDRG